jgi:hypothetical protein
MHEIKQDGYLNKTAIGCRCAAGAPSEGEAVAPGAGTTGQSATRRSRGSDMSGMERRPFDNQSAGAALAGVTPEPGRKSSLPPRKRS